MADFTSGEINNTTANGSALIKRGFMALEDKEWTKADGFFEQALNIDAEIAEAYLGKLLAELKLSAKEELMTYSRPFDENKNYQKTIRFGNEELKRELSEYSLHAKETSEKVRCENLYNLAVKNMNIGRFEEAINNLRPISNYKDAGELNEECTRLIEERRKEGVYISACNMLTNAKTADDALQAKAVFETIIDYKDSASKAMECLVKEDEIVKAEREKEKNKIDWQSIRKIWAIILVPIIAIVVIAVFHRCIVPEIELMNNYNKAEKLLDDGSLGEAYEIYADLEGYKDSEEMKEIIDAFNVKTIAAGGRHTVAVKEDGTVVAVGNEDAYSSGYSRYSGYSQSVKDWTDIEAVAAGFTHTVGLKSDGTVVAEGYSISYYKGVESWYDIEAIAAGSFHTVGLKSDGAVVAVGDNDNGQCNVSDWEDIVAIAAGEDVTLGLKDDGTVVAVGNNESGQLDDVENWEDIVAITVDYAGNPYGLKLDGDVEGSNSGDGVVAISGDIELKSDGDVKGGHRGESEWTDIIGISKHYHSVGLKKDGTVVAVGDSDINEDGELNVGSWRNIKVPEAFK